MTNDELLEVYLRKTIEYCGIYDAFSIPAAMISGGTEIKLQDIYTYLPVVERNEYETAKRRKYNDGGLSRNEMGTTWTSPLDINEDDIQLEDLDKLLRDIDAKLAALDVRKGKEENQTNDLEQQEDKMSVDEKPPFAPGVSVNWEWYLSEPGGGKTTLLKMYSLAYAYKYYIEKFGQSEKLLVNTESVERVCDLLEIKDGQCPFFISVRDLKEEDYPDVSESRGFKKVIIDVIRTAVDDEVSEFDADGFLDSITRPIFIVDSVEEFESEDFRWSFLNGLDAFSSGNKCYLSSRYREYMEDIKDTKLERDDGTEILPLKECVIDKLENNKDVVVEFAKNWYSALNSISGRNLDVEKDFLIPVYNNDNVKNLITNPLELASLLMISSYDSCLPSNYVTIYARSIELWLGRRNPDRYNYDDVMRQLSKVAYQMAVSEKEKIVVSESTLFSYIRQVRDELKRYYHQEWSDDEMNMRKFIQYLLQSHLISKSTEGYSFVHRQYQAYLVAYCITTNNFSRETRKKRRIDYVEERLLKKDDFWKPIINIIVMLDIELRDDVIEKLFILSKEKNEDQTNYYVSLLIDLAIIPGVNFDEYELEKLFELIIYDDKNWRLFSTKKKDLQKLFELNDEYGNDLFIRTAIKRKEELGEGDRGKFSDSISSLIFYCIWYCKLETESINNAFSAFMTNYITFDIIGMICESKAITARQRNVMNIIYSLGENAIKSGDFSDYYMIIAVMIANETEGGPYFSIDANIKANTFESKVIAVNILVIAAWLIRCGRASKYGFEPTPNGLTKYADFVVEGILDVDHEKMQRDYLAAFEDVFACGVMENHESEWFQEKTFVHVLKRAILQYKEENVFFDSDDNEFSRCLRHISLYPCEHKKLCRRVLNEELEDAKPIYDRLKAVYDKEDDDIMNKVYATKLLILTSDLTYEERAVFIKGLEKEVSSAKIKRKLKNNDMEKTYNLCMNQIKGFMPEGQMILEGLDLSGFSLNLDNSPVPDVKMVDSKKNNDVNSFDEERYIDYYAEGNYEEAKKSYMRSFELLSSRNNLAYMLRRGEIASVKKDGVDYSVEELLKEGVKALEPYSLINFALYTSFADGCFRYEIGLAFLKQYKTEARLLEAASWWYKLKQNGELEGYVVLMWLCDMGLGIFETKEELKKVVDEHFPNLVEY